MFWFFGWEACGILTPQQEIELAPPALEGEVLTTGPPGKSLDVVLKALFLLTNLFFIITQSSSTNY